MQLIYVTNQELNASWQHVQLHVTQLLTPVLWRCVTQFETQSKATLSTLSHAADISFLVLSCLGSVPAPASNPTPSPASTPTPATTSAPAFVCDFDNTLSAIMPLTALCRLCGRGCNPFGRVGLGIGIWYRCCGNLSGMLCRGLRAEGIC